MRLRKTTRVKCEGMVAVVAVTSPKEQLACRRRRLSTGMQSPWGGTGRRNDIYTKKTGRQGGRRLRGEANGEGSAAAGPGLVK